MTVLPSIASLMSPPETKPFDSFNLTPVKTPSLSSDSVSPLQTYASHLPAMGKPSTPDQKLRILPSPPVSPWMSKQNKIGREGYNAGSAVENVNTYPRDPVLFDSESFESDDRPLFPEDGIKSADDLIDKHMAMHMVQFKNKLNRPTRDEYRLALSCIPNIGAQYNRNPGAYMKRQREETEDDYWQAKRLCAQPGQKASTKASPIAIAPAPRPGKRMIKPAALKPNVPRVKRTPKASPIAKLMNYPQKGRSSETPERVPGAKREDVDYNSLPDYSPPLSTLPNNPKVLKADWPSNNVLNLSNDPDRHLLHEAEVTLAATLRLSCATYLCSKRRIFDARVTALRIGKEFRKTDAQQACKIDVNKASKLWTAYDRVGWFHPDFFRPHLNQ